MLCLGGGAARTADPAGSKGYSMAYGVALNNKSSRKGGGKGDVGGYSICLSKQLLGVLKPCFPTNS